MATEAPQQAQAEKLTLLVADNKSGYFGVNLTKPDQPNPYKAQVEKLTLLVAENKAGYFGVSLDKPGKPKPYQARVRRGGKMVYLGTFATAEEAAL